jgi:hypothetical protein
MERINHLAGRVELLPPCPGGQVIPMEVFQQGLFIERRHPRSGRHDAERQCKAARLYGSSKGLPAMVRRGASGAAQALAAVRSSSAGDAEQVRMSEALPPGASAERRFCQVS